MNLQTVETGDVRYTVRGMSPTGLYDVPLAHFKTEELARQWVKGTGIQQRQRVVIDERKADYPFTTLRRIYP